MQVLNPRNYHTWKADMMIFLRCENALDIALGREDPPDCKATFAKKESYQKRFGHATGMIYSSVEPNIRAIINKLPDRNPARVWKALDKKFNSAASRSGRLAIRRKFHSFVQDYISRLTTIQQELLGTPEEISDEILVSHLLANLSEKIQKCGASLQFDQPKMKRWIQLPLSLLNTRHKMRFAKIRWDQTQAQQTIFQKDRHLWGKPRIQTKASNSLDENVEIDEDWEKDEVTETNLTTRNQEENVSTV